MKLFKKIVQYVYLGEIPDYDGFTNWHKKQMDDWDASNKGNINNPSFHKWTHNDEYLIPYNVYEDYYRYTTEKDRGSNDPQILPA